MLCLFKKTKKEEEEEVKEKQKALTLSIDSNLEDINNHLSNTTKLLTSSRQITNLYQKEKEWLETLKSFVKRQNNQEE